MRNASARWIEARGRWRLRSRAAALILAPMLAFALAGPASAIEILGFKLFENKADEETPIVDPLSYTVSLELVDGGEDGGLRDRLEAASALVSGAGKPVSGSVGLVSRASSDFEQLLAVLYEDARYGGIVRIVLDGRPLKDLPPDADLSASGPVTVQIVVTPGRQFHFRNIRIDSDDGVYRDPQSYGLVTGEVAGSMAILSAEEALVGELKNSGHPLAEVTDRDVVADHASAAIDLVLSLAPGPMAPFGETSVEGATEVDPAFVREMTGIVAGETYDPGQMKAAANRLRSLDVFSSVTVRGRDQLDENGSLPVDVTVSERKHRFIGAGATFSSTDGGGLEAYWGHRNLFGRAEKLRVEGSVSGLGETGAAKDLTYRGALLFEKPGIFGPASKFSSRLSVAQENPDAYRRFSVAGFAGISRELNDKQTVSAGLDVEYAKLADSFSANLETLTVALPIEFVHDARDNRLNPAAGYRLVAGVEPAWETLGSNVFVKVRGEASVYRALDEARRLIVAARLAGGSIIGSDLAGVPANRRFYAGGGGSVRGYGYQGIGPRDALGRPTGGRSMLEGSLEARIGVSENVGIVPFIDAGMVSADSYLAGAQLRLGTGVGIRYATPFGPLRLDVAVPLNKGPLDPDYGVYAGIGQAF